MKNERPLAPQNNIKQGASLLLTSANFSQVPKWSTIIIHFNLSFQCTVVLGLCILVYITCAVADPEGGGSLGSSLNNRKMGVVWLKVGVFQG